ncbi:hypothetical protein QBC43DRAFT_351554 [Cladorrhinum sp. PSN259]|nr:hypothetical protein QBC43DRAFT_351554 [Cladorrhinum sp. PSN259]
MVLSSAVTIGGSILKRSLVQRYSNDDPGQTNPPTDGSDLPVLAQIQAWINILVFLPVIIYITYTLGSIFPTLAAIEDPLPAYEQIPINDPTLSADAPIPGANPVKKSSSSPRINLDADVESSGASSSAQAAWSSPVPVTSSLRRTGRLLSSISGFRSHFRGFGYLLISQFITALGASPFYLVLGPRLAHLLSLLLFTHLRTAWVHIVITPPSTQRWWKRIPSYRRTLVATYIPILCYWAALHVGIVIPYIIAGVAGLTGIDEDHKNLSAGQATFLSILGSLGVLLSVAVVVPAETALLRVQASLLPEDEDTIVPFDRSFGGRVEPRIVTGKGFPGVKAALATVSRASWRRIVGQQIKIFGVSFVLFFGIMIVVGLQAMVWR